MNNEEVETAPASDGTTAPADNEPARPAWAQSSQLLRDYYDTEWGFEVTDSDAIYEQIALEGFQAGLAWQIVLRKRPALRNAFAGFDPEAVARFGAAEVENLLSNPAIIRNERKIRAAIANARATVDLRRQGVDLGELVWSFTPADRYGPGPQAGQSEESRALAAKLKSHGFKLVGPVTMFALMQAIGIYQHRES